MAKVEEYMQKYAERKKEIKRLLEDEVKEEPRTEGCSGPDQPSSNSDEDKLELITQTCKMLTNAGFIVEEERRHVHAYGEKPYVYEIIIKARPHKLIKV
jgi:hypothetical protein